MAVRLWPMGTITTAMMDLPVNQMMTLTVMVGTSFLLLLHHLKKLSQ